ncbi:MAG: hypothetical protein M3Z54_00385 [Gemmatimonadota bacterium]|nr:hypothetical protein [Gemmatimonadota bacterium]
MSALALAFVATTARAQVGHLPENSPFRDLETSQELTLFGGRFMAGLDPVGVAPRSGPVYGLRYEIHVGGPALLMARWAHVNSERFPIDPTKSGAAAQLGRRSVSLNLYDVSLVINLTGEKSFHHIVPVVSLGAGIGSCSCTVQPDPYTFGTPFAFSFGGGLRYVPGGRFQLRADWGDYLYQIKYPDAYYLKPTTGTAAAGSTQARSFWKNNRSLTLGASLLFFR